MDQVASAVAQATKEWRRLGVVPQTRLDLGAELQADLEAAVSDGRAARDVTGPDIPAFARDWAYARGDVPVRAFYLRAFTGAWAGLLAGGTVTIGVGELASFARTFFSNGSAISFNDHGSRLAWVFIVVGVGAYLGAVAGSYLALARRDDPFARRTAVYLSWTFAIGCLIALAAGVGTAASVNYANTHAFVVAEFVLVGGVLSAAVMAARRLAVGTPSLLAGPGQAPAPHRVDVSF